MEANEAKTALLSEAAVAADSFQSHAPALNPSKPPNTLLENVFRTEAQANEPTVTVNVAHLEQLLRTCAEALARTRQNATPSAQPIKAPPAGDGLIKGSHIPNSIDEKNLHHDHRKFKHGNALKFYELTEGKEEVVQNEQAWRDSKIKWKPILDRIGDVWQDHFPNCKHRFFEYPHRKCHQLAEPIVRLECQRDLVLARLNLEQGNPTPKDAERFLSWLSVIAYKLEQLHTLTHNFSRMLFRRKIRDGKVRQESNNFLVEVLRYFYEGPGIYLANGEDFIIDSLLNFCYRRGVLGSPTSPTDPALENNFRHVVHALWVLNIIQTPRYWLTFTISANIVQQRVPVIGSYVLDILPHESIHRSVDEIETALQQRQPDLPHATGENVRCEDLNLSALRNIGGLRIVWTASDRDHLFLDQENGVLRLSYFNRVLVPEFYKYMPNLGQNDVARTWTLLLGYRKDTDDVSELAYIPLPPELSAYSAYLRRRRSKIPIPRRLRRTKSSTLVPSGLSMKHYADIQDKLQIEMQPLPRSVPYDYFGRYEQRIRVLRHYMDTRKPTGFRNLWHDRRDSLSYYTFWAVLIFGGVSILLAGLSVALGVAQTVAAFRQLEQNDR